MENTKNLRKLTRFLQNRFSLRFHLYFRGRDASKTEHSLSVIICLYQGLTKVKLCISIFLLDNDLDAKCKSNCLTCLSNESLNHCSISWILNSSSCILEDVYCHFLPPYLFLTPSLLNSKLS